MSDRYVPYPERAQLERDVKAAAKELDAKVPDWIWLINLSKLRMSEGVIYNKQSLNEKYPPCGCIGAQLDWHFQKAKASRRLTPSWSRALRRLRIGLRGFHSMHANLLDSLWRKEIETRRKAERNQPETSNT